MSTDLILGADANGPEAPPRQNGELVFDAPWQGRAFGTGIALAEQGTYPFSELRDRLIEAIAGWDPGSDWSYYERWLTALEALLVDRDLIATAEIDARMHEIAAHSEHEHDH